MDPFVNLLTQIQQVLEMISSSQSILIKYYKQLCLKLSKVLHENLIFKGEVIQKKWLIISMYR